MGEKTFVKLFPEIVDSVVTIDDILKRAEELHKNDKDNRALQNLLSGKTKRGIYGEEFFIMINGSISDVKLKKKSIYRLLNIDKLSTSKLDMFIESNNLSLKKVDDIIKLLEYYSNI